MMPTYGVPPVALVRGEGCRVWDADGKQYTDLIAGIAVSALGHAHPAITEAVTRQVHAIAHTSNLFLHEGEVALAERLLAPARRRRPGVLHQLGHRGQRGRAQAGPPPPGPVPPGDRRRRERLPRPDHGLARADRQGGDPRSRSARSGSRSGSCPTATPPRCRPPSAPDCAAVFLEPCPGRGGGGAAARRVPAAAAREACDAAGALLVIDEIQSGIGRTGAWFAHQADGVVPDVLTLAKGLGGGLPIGACIGLGAAGTALRKGDHGSTFGGNPVACAAALAVLATIESDGLLAQRRRWASRLAAGLARRRHPLLRGVRGTGPLARRAADPAGRRPRWRPPAARPGSSSTPCSRTRSGSPRR